MVSLSSSVSQALPPVVGPPGGWEPSLSAFSWPGLGRYLVDAVGSRDFPALQGALLVTAAAFLLVNLAVDLGYALIDPRLRRPASGTSS